MKMYKVRWEIDLDANNPREAAEKALAIHRDTSSIATIFEVEHTHENTRYIVDLWHDTVSRQ